MNPLSNTLKLTLVVLVISALTACKVDVPSSPQEAAQSLQQLEKSVQAELDLANKSLAAAQASAEKTKDSALEAASTAKKGVESVGTAGARVVNATVSGLEAIGQAAIDLGNNIAPPENEK